MTTALQLQAVSKRYGKRSILQQISLEVAAGEFFGLVGVNGAGKTTLLKSLLDFCEINSGSINIFDQPHRQPQARQYLAFLPEQFVPPDFLRGDSFLRYMAGCDGQDYQPQKAQQLCEKLNLDQSALRQAVRKYSKGMAQKLGLLSCFLREKPLLILDEPMSGLDPRARAYLKKYLLTLKQAGHTTMFFSTHLLVDVEALCDRMAILHDGRLRFVGTPSDCCQQYGVDNLEQAYLCCIES